MTDPVYYLILAIAIAVVTFLFLCIIICSFNSLKAAIDVIDAAADFYA